MAERITLNVNEVAELIGLSPTTIYKKAKKGDIPHTRLGGTIIFHRGVIDAWLRGELKQAQA